MDIQRYDVSISGFDGVYLLPSEAGSYVSFKDHLSALSKSQERVKELEAMLDEILSENPSCSCFDWDKARSILGAKEEGT